MKIAIIGATRGIGLQLAQLALADGHDVTVLARDPSRMPISHERLRIVSGAAEDLESIRELVRGQDVVCDCLGTRNVLKTITMFSRCAENLVKCLAPEQLLIAVTGLGAGDSRGHLTWRYDHFMLPVVLGRQYADKNRQEEIIKRGIKRWIIVRPGFLTDGPRTGRYKVLLTPKEYRAGRISRADVADFVLSQAKAPQFIGQTPLLVY